MNNIMQEKIKKEAEGYGKLAPAFIEGARFALENQWISVKDDLPCNHEELYAYNNKTVAVIVRGEFANIDVDYMKLYRDKWEWVRHYRTTHWMPIPELSKE